MSKININQTNQFNQKFQLNPMNLNYANSKDIINEPILKSDYVQCNQKRLEDLLKDKSKLVIKFKNKEYSCFKSMASQKLFYLVIGIINFILVILAISTSIKKNIYYKNFKLEILFYTEDNPLSFKKFWCEIGQAEDGVLISYLIWLILYIGFEIFTYLIQKGVITLKLEGILYHIIVGLNCFFLVIFYIYIPLTFYLFIYTIIVIAVSPYSVDGIDDSFEREVREVTYNEEQWETHRTNPAVNGVIIFILFIFNLIQLSIKNEIMLYLSRRYADKENIVKEEVKKKTIYKKDKSFNIEVKANQILYLEEKIVGKEINTYTRFKQVRINGNNNFFYVRLDNKGINDILSFTDWEFPDLNEIFQKLGSISKLIYGVLFMSIPLLKMHISTELIYTLLVEAYYSTGLQGSKKPKYFDIFMLYGDFEKSFTESRFALLTISLFFILLIMLKRIYLGGFSKYIFSLISFIASFFLIFEILIFIFLSLFLALLTIFSLVSYYDTFTEVFYDMIPAKLFIQLFVNIIITVLLIKLLSENIRLSSSLNIIRIEVKNLYNSITLPNEAVKPGYQYKSIEEPDKQLYLGEVQLEGHPRYLFYTLYDDIKKIPDYPKIIDIYNNEKNQESNSILVHNNDVNHFKNKNITIYQNEENQTDKKKKIKKRRNCELNTNQNKKEKELNEKQIASENRYLKSKNKSLRMELSKYKNQLNLLSDKSKI